MTSNKENKCLWHKEYGPFTKEQREKIVREAEFVGQYQAARNHHISQSTISLWRKQILCNQTQMEIKNK